MGRKSEESRDLYNKIAFEYDKSSEGLYTAFHIKELVNSIELRDSDAVLDVACGNGSLLGKLSDAAKICAYGIDFSEKMITVARKRYPEIAFKVQSCCPLEFKDGSLDVITVCCSFHHFETPQRFTDECHRVIKRNGRVYLADPYFSPLVRFMANNLVFRVSKKGDVRVYSEKELKGFFYKAGFSKVETYKKGVGVFLTAIK